MNTLKYFLEFYSPTKISQELGTETPASKNKNQREIIIVMTELPPQKIFNKIILTFTDLFENIRSILTVYSLTKISQVLHTETPASENKNQREIIIVIKTPTL